MYEDFTTDKELKKRRKEIKDKYGRDQALIPSYHNNTIHVWIRWTCCFIQHFNLAQWAWRHHARSSLLSTSPKRVWMKVPCCCHACFELISKDFFPCACKNLDCQFDADCNYHFAVAFLATFGGNQPAHIEMEVVFTHRFLHVRVGCKSM